MPDTTLRLQTNVPETIALEFADGLPVQSRFGGDQIMFSLVDGRKMYLAPFVADKIAAAGIGAGQPFQICKREQSNGNRRIVDYVIERANGTGTARTAPAPAANKPTPESPASSASTYQTPAPAAAATPAALMTTAGRAAVDAVLEIEKYAQSRGMTDFAFGPDNLQAIAVSIFIALDRKGARA